MAYPVHLDIRIVRNEINLIIHVDQTTKFALGIFLYPCRNSDDHFAIYRADRDWGRLSTIYLKIIVENETV